MKNRLGNNSGKLSPKFTKFKMLRRFYIVLFALILFFLTFCVERERINPLDPLGKQISPISLSVLPKNKSVRLSWTVNRLAEYTGFRIYRARGKDSNYQVIAELPADVYQFLDQDIRYHYWYSYYVTVLGKNVESKPSTVEKVFPGPGETWILSRYGYFVSRISYDLQHPIDTYFTAWPPTSWTWDTDNKNIYLCSSQYGQVSRLNIQSGLEDFHIENEALIQPVDLKFVPSSATLAVLDARKEMVFLFRHMSLSDSFEIGSDTFFRLQISGNGNLWILGEKSVEAYSIRGDLFFHKVFKGNFEGSDIVSERNTIFILTHDVNLQQSQIFRYDETDETLNSMNINGNFFLIRKVKNKDYFWLTEEISSDNERLVKLSASGNRLLEVPEVENIYNFSINETDESLVTVNRYRNTATLLDSTGTVISSKKEIYDPIRVVIH